MLTTRKGLPGRLMSVTRMTALAVALAALAALAPPVPAAVATLEIRVLSNRADLIAGGDALVEVVLPAKVLASTLRVSVGGRDVTSAFALRDNGRFMGLVTGLTTGDNVLTARAKGASTAQITITNHPIGGPVFSGAQVGPWICSTDDGGLGPAQDDQCNAPTRYTFQYKNALTGQFAPYDPASPPPAGQISTTVTDQDHVVPYIVRIERGTMNRGIHDIAVLFNPSEPQGAGPVRRELRARSPTGDAGQCDGRPGAVPGLHGLHQLDECPGPALQRRDVGRNGDDAQGARRRDLRRDPLYDRQRLLGRLDPAAPHRR